MVCVFELPGASLFEMRAPATPTLPTPLLPSIPPFLSQTTSRQQNVQQVRSRAPDDRRLELSTPDRVILSVAAVSPLANEESVCYIHLFPFSFLQAASKLHAIFRSIVSIQAWIEGTSRAIREKNVNKLVSLRGQQAPCMRE